MWSKKRESDAARQKASDTRVADILNSKFPPIMQPLARRIAVGGKKNENKKV